MAGIMARSESSGDIRGEAVMRGWRIAARLFLVLALLAGGAHIRAANEADGGREKRWEQLCRGEVFRYLDACRAGRGRPGWGLEDEVDLAMGHWWLLAADYRNPEIQDRFHAALERGIDDHREELRRPDSSPEHRALMGNLLIVAGQVQAARGSYFSAAGHAREGYRMLEAVRQCNPEIAETYFALGLYLYYVDLSSPLVRSLQRLLFFPPGDTRLGLRYLEKTARESRRFGPMARVALAAIYATDRGRLDLALDHLRTLRHAYPENPFLLRFTIEVLTDLGDYDRARELLDDAEELSRREDFAFAAWHRDVYAFLRARLDADDFRLDRAAGTLDVLVSGEGNRPGWVRPAAAGSLARLSLLAGDERRYRELLRAPWSEGHDGSYRRRMKRLPERLAREGYDQDLHQVFRHWISADLDGARERLRRLREMRGDRGRVPYLLGEIHRLQGNVEGAEEAYRAVLAQGAAAPIGAAGWSLVRLGDLHAGRGDRDAARRCYLRALELEGFAEHRVAGHRLRTMAGRGAPARRQGSDQSR